MSKFDKATKITAREKRTWLKALRSGEYAQGKHALKQGAGLFDEGFCFCCLGVLCEVVPRLQSTSKAFLKAGKLEFDTYIGIPGSAQGRLAASNDSGRTFKQIAAQIERSKL